MAIEQLMPKQMLTAALEIIINKAISLDNKTSTALTVLNGKSLTVQLTELGFPLTLLVSGANISVIASELSNDCVIQSNLKTLPKLKQSELLTSLIRSGELDIVGDPKIAQQFASVFEHLNIDWEAQLAKRIGDIPAFKLAVLGKKVQQKFAFAESQISQDAGEYLLHEKKLIVSTTELNNFVHSVSDAVQQLEQLQQRLSHLDSQLNTLS
ncbi:SCP2 domain-containing protein [Colwelliaceae bacterium BS250]